ncbi:GntR family transcriptional regulator [Amycolatopsis antarctica]|uniref:GntR family transcriptional regulator n=1 Tax=Amycolatopsis antarctica TaxID=1854586 RepID=A0A263D3D3_9PSEU|nr:GntR family transcriptional regulator [Amycolatopsis antarctica]OZM72588.1 GntR family transcriptional regulator [Amycolatopsis antarctica]
MPVPETQNVSPRSLLRDSAFRLLRDAIVDGTLAPGERLRDNELESWLGVSRTPIREALARLEQAGLVRTRPGRSTTVSPLDLTRTREAQLVVAAMHELAVREAVPLLTGTDIDRMRAANDRFAGALRAGDPDTALLADDEFHAVTVSAAGNQAVVSVLGQLTPVLRRVERLRFSSLSGRASVAQHERIVSLCGAGDAEAAALATRENWHTLQPLLDLPKRREQGAGKQDTA